MNAEHKPDMLQTQINRLKNLPALPEASVKILEAINDPEVSIDSLADVLSLSPDLTARLLGLANSAYFGQSRTVTDIRTAIFQVLGLQLVKSLALGIVLNVQFDSSKCQSFDTEYFWMRSLLTAVTAQKLANEVSSKGQVDPPTAYTGGLLLNIGVLVMAYLVPDGLNEILLRCQKQDLQVHEQIQQQLGQSHFYLGFTLLQKWHLPAVYQLILEHFEDRNFGGAEGHLMNLLRSSQLISSTILRNEPFKPEILERIASELGIKASRLTDLVDKLIENKEGIQHLAQAMG